MNWTKLVLFLVLCEAISTALANNVPDGRRDGLIQEAVKSLLGVKEKVELNGIQKKRQLVPPRYMLDLYDQYKSGTLPTQGNTVRSILPMRGTFQGVDMLVFNLTGIHPEEQILQGKLHLYMRKTSNSSRRRNDPMYQMKVIDLGSQSETQLLEFRHRQKQNWVSRDITKSVTLCRSKSNEQGDHLLGVYVGSKRRRRKFRPMFLRRVLRLSSEPFLIIFSEDRNNKTEPPDKDMTKENFGLELFGNTIFNSTHTVDGISIENILMTRIRRSLLEEAEADEVLRVLRRARSLSFNEVLRSDYAEGNFNSTSLTEEQKLLAKYSRKIDPNLIPSPHHVLQAKRQRMWRNRKNRRRKNRKLPRWWIKHEGKHVHSNLEKACQRKKLVVDFSKIGWNEWVISPNSFDAYYCGGKCSFPLIKNGRPSNHATIQSLVQAFGNDDVPAPCCVPTATSSLTMLYFDEHESVVLKNYPNMIAESCACR